MLEPISGSRGAKIDPFGSKLIADQSIGIMSSIQQLPLELLDQILMLLPGSSIQALCHTCHQFVQLFRDESFWRRKYELDYGRTSWDDLTEEFTELLPGNWRRAYYCRWLTRQYSAITPRVRVTQRMVRHELEHGSISKHDLTRSTQEALGLWNREVAFQKLWDEEIKASIDDGDWSGLNSKDSHQLLDEIHNNVNEEINDDIRRHDETASYEIGKPIRIYDFTEVSRNADILGSSQSSPENWISAETIITPKIITIVIDSYNREIQRLTEINGFHRKFRGFEYTYATAKNGFTLREFFLNVKDALTRYCYMAMLMWSRKLPDDINNVEVEGIEYCKGRYHVISNHLGY